MVLHSQYGLLIKTWLLATTFSLCTYAKTEVGLTSYPLSILGGKDQISLPFEYQQGFIVVKVYMEKFLSLNFVLDTGAENTILLKPTIAELLHLPYNKRIKVYGSDLSSEIIAHVSNGVQLELENTKSINHNIVVMEDHYTFLEECIGIKVDGILGAEFFKGLILKINYKAKILTLIDPTKFDTKKLSKYDALPIKIVNSKPYLTCIAAVSQDQSTAVDLLVDTGAGLSVLFHDNTDSLLHLPNNIIKGQLGVGLGGDIVGYNGKIHSLSIGNFIMPNLISSFQSLDESLIDSTKLIRNGLIGNLILERFDIYLDLMDSMIYLKPHKNFTKPVKFDKSGLTIFAFGPNLDDYYVKSIIDGSPADLVGIKIGDVITKVGCWPTSFYTFNTIVNKLSGDADEVVRLKVKREDKNIKFRIKLKDLFN